MHSIVIPIFNESEGLRSLFSRMTKVLDQITGPTEVILVNDGSSDGSELLLDQLCEEDPRFKVIHFSRNFGHQIAITAGTQYASGKTVTVIDADLQDPPEVILEFIKMWTQGFEVVYGVRRSRAGESWFKRITARAFYRVIRKVTQLDIPVDVGDFRLMDRKVAEAFLSLPERHRYVRGLMSWVGFKQIGVPYDRAARVHGETHYPFSKMLKLAFDGVSSFSLVPLRMATWMGFFVALLSVIGIFYTLYLKFIAQETVQGWASLLFVVLFLGSVQLLSLGIIGEYLGRVFDEVRGRPLYLVTREKGFSQKLRKAA